MGKEKRGNMSPWAALPSQVPPHFLSVRSCMSRVSRAMTGNKSRGLDADRLEVLTAAGEQSGNTPGQDVACLLM